MNVHETYQYWLDKWDEALMLWVRYTRLNKPVFCFTEEDDISQSINQNIAVIF